MVKCLYCQIELEGSKMWTIEQYGNEGHWGVAILHRGDLGCIQTQHYKSLASNAFTLPKKLE